jgi:16S rRNA G966 N2-methylase RsmD
MGSKAALASQIAEAMFAFEGPDTVVLDLMCGSGVMAGAFARTHKVFASDAQEFSRLLAVVQGGGMSCERALAISEQVVAGARAQYSQKSARVAALIEEESEYLGAELTSTVRGELTDWLRGRLATWTGDGAAGFDAVCKAHSTGELLSFLYGGLYFGERQACELDCLRISIEDVRDPVDREWALGVLVCAASACAFTYGGHFAQPKVTVANVEGSAGLLHDLVQQRSLSVAHEFCARMEALGKESERVANQVRCVKGPWQAALSAMANMRFSNPVCVYLDPPYTRDEYSRYYHVLECMVRYAPTAVSGKGRIPARGTGARFASEFSVRRPAIVESHIARVIDSCLALGWSCLWSYSDSGTASVDSTIRSLSQQVGRFEVFRMDHFHRVHGRRAPLKPGKKDVKEFVVYLQPAR